MSGRARKNRRRQPKGTQSGAPVEQPDNGSSSYPQRQGQQATDPAPEPAPARTSDVPGLEAAQAPAPTQARERAEILAQPTARALTWSERVARPTGWAQAPARARAPVPTAPPPTVTPVQPSAAQASIPAKYGKASTGLKEPSQGKKQSSRKSFHDLDVNTQQKLHHLIECKRGTSGTVVHLKTNYFRLTSLPQWALYQYRVNFNPQMDSRQLRSVLLGMHKQLLGKQNVSSKDFSIFYYVTEAFSQTHSGENVWITITLTNELLPNSPTCVQFYNMIFRRHNNRTYRVDDIDWEQNPRSTFKKDGSDISFLEYYEQQYGIKITDLEQPVLVSLPRRTKGPDGRPTSPVLLVSELCNLTGAVNDRITKNIAKYTRLSPERRHSGLQNLIDNIHRNADVQRELQEWGLNFEKQSLALPGRVLPVQKLNEDINTLSIQCTDWSNEITKRRLRYPKPLTHWLFVFNHENSRLAQILWEKLNLTTQTLGIKLRPPKRCPVQDKTEEYLQVLENNITSQTQIAVCLLPDNKKEKYDAIKKYLCITRPVPSQCIVAGTLKNPQTLLSVVTRLALQMNCKIGGHLWKISIPLKDAMFIGIDCYHEVTSGRKSVAGFVASLDTSLTKWYSRCLFHKPGQELLDGLRVCLEKALKAWKDNNKQCPLPKFIFVYRDGVGDGQLQTVVDYEVPQMLRCLNSLPKYSYKLVIIVVKKRVNARFFVEKGGYLINPSAGTVIDMEVTRPEWYDFFIISQSVKAGSVTPTHYNVIFDNTDLNPDQIQCLTYKLCYMYYNWTGVIRVPAPCQYAHKLAFLVGQSVHESPHDELSDRLYYL